MKDTKQKIKDLKKLQKNIYDMSEDEFRLHLSKVNLGKIKTRLRRIQKTDDIEPSEFVKNLHDMGYVIYTVYIPNGHLIPIETLEFYGRHIKNDKDEKYDCNCGSHSCSGNGCKCS